MRKWLRGWFAWRFSLRRLVIATIFLGAIMGLNLYGTNWGWPLPFNPVRAELDMDLDALRDGYVRTSGRRTEVAEGYWFHHFYSSLRQQPYHLLDFASMKWLCTKNGGIVCILIDVLFALTALFLILFLQIPRRRADSPADPAPRPPQTPPADS